MAVTTVTEAEAQISALLDRVEAGEEVIISRGGTPVAILRPYATEPRQRVPGRLKGKIRIADDFDDLPPDIAGAFGMKPE